MKRRKTFFFVLFVLLTASISACHLVPSRFEIETTSELGPNTLNRIDDINDTLATGLEIGPETRATIEELNKTIDEGLEFGFTESTLQRVDVLLAMIEQGVGIKAGLDAETNQTVNNLIETLDDQPGQWEDTMTAIITTLEGSTSRVAEQMADEVQGLMVEARINTQQLSASMGAEFRCNVDFMSTRAGDTLDQFIGRSLVGRLQEIVTGEEMEEEEGEIPIPMVCQMVPDQISLEKVGGEFVFETAVVRISGYNFMEENKPHAYVVDEAGDPVEAVELYPFLSSPYQIQLNLQDIDFSAVPTRSRVVFEWPTAGSFFALAMVLPSEAPTPTPEVKPELTINVSQIEVRKGPGEKYKPIGKAAQGAIYEVTGHNGNQTWWQIDFEGDPGWVPNSAVIRNEEQVGTASSIPLDPPEAAFSYSMDPESGKAPVDVHFLNESTGDPTFTAWYVILEGENASQIGSEQEITYEFTKSGAYTVRLVVKNEWGEDQVEKDIQIEKPDITFIPQLFIPMEVAKFPTATPSYTRNIIFRNYTNIHAGEVFTTDIRTDQYNCGVVGLAALHGDIEEHHGGNVIKIWLSRSGVNWRIEANFRTHRHDHGGQEKWSIGLMCVESGLSEFYSNVYIQPQSGNTVELNPSMYDIPENYTCSIAGYDVKDVDIPEATTGDIIQVFTRKNEDGAWEVTADFLDSGRGLENWLVQLLCFYDNQGKILDYDDPETDLDIFAPEFGGYRTDISSNDYACGIAGMHAISGDVQEDNNGDIIRAYTYMYDGRWWVFADFRTHHENEKWDIDLICAHRSVVGIDPTYWLGEWIKR
ncbi:MAG: SH3 domain-containing protein [Anaerolineales bacterium]